MPGSIPHEMRRERAERLAKTAESAAKRRRADFDGRCFDMFIEKIRADRVFGYTENMIYGDTNTESDDSEKQYPVIHASICTGEKVAGFKNYDDGHFTEVMLIRNAEDEKRFKAIYGLDEVKKEY